MRPLVRLLREGFAMTHFGRFKTNTSRANVAVREPHRDIRVFLPVTLQITKISNLQINYFSLHKSGLICAHNKCLAGNEYFQFVVAAIE